MNSNNRLIALLVVVATALAVPAANAAVAQAATFDEKVDNAVAIILGKCVKTEAKFDCVMPILWGHFQRPARAAPKHFAMQRTVRPSSPPRKVRSLSNFTALREAGCREFRLTALRLSLLPHRNPCHGRNR